MAESGEVLKVTESQFSNVTLKRACHQLHSVIVRDLNCDESVLDILFEKGVLNIYDMEQIADIPINANKNRRLMMILHKSRNSEAFIQFYMALQHDEKYRWIADEIEKLYFALQGQQMQQSAEQGETESERCSGTDIDDDEITMDDLKHRQYELQSEQTRLGLQHALLLEQLQLQKMQLDDLLFELRKKREDDKELRLQEQMQQRMNQLKQDSWRIEKADLMRKNYKK